MELTISLRFCQSSMSLESKIIDRDGNGTIKLLPQEDEDMWHIFNLIAVGDHINAVCHRKVNKDKNSTRSAQSQRITISLTILVESVDFDSKFCQIRLKGKNT